MIDYRKALDDAFVRVMAMVTGRVDRELAKPRKSYRRSLGQLYSARGKHGRV